MKAINSKNFIARCAWDTSIDNEEYSYHLQQFISQWTQPDLQKLFDRCVKDICPENRHLRIDKLELNLGKIQYSDLHTSLPEKVEEVLRSALKEQVKKLAINNKSNTGEDESIVLHSESLASDGNNSDKAATDWFIEHGTAPWWYRTGDSICDALNRQLAASANFIQGITEKIRGRDTLRQRVLWQWGEQGCRHIVEHLEPQHAMKVESVINGLCSLNRKSKVFELGNSELSEFLWRMAAEYLIRNRAASFNIQWLSQLLLLSLSEKFHKSHDEMVNHLITSCNDPEQSKILRSTTLKEIPIAPWLEVVLPYKSGKAQTELTLMAELLLQMKAVIQVHYPENPKESKVALQDLFSKLAISQPKKLIRLLKQIGKESSIRRHLLNQLDHEHRIEFVQLLAPNDSSFICAHTRRTKIVITEQKKDSEIVWDIVFAYLLQDSGTHFNRLQFVKQTLEKTGHEHGISYYQLLQLLLHSVVVNAGFEQRIELIEIIERLHKEEKLRRVESNRVSVPIENVLKAYLLKEQFETASSNYQVPQHDELIHLINDEPIRIFKLLKQCLSEGTNQKNHLVFKHLINLMGAGEFRQWINAQIMANSPSLRNVLLQVEHWHKNACLRSLNLSDATTSLYRSSLEVMIFQRGETSAKPALISWLNRLASMTGSDTRELIEEIQFCINNRSYLLNIFDNEDYSQLNDQDLSTNNKIESSISDRDLLSQLQSELSDISYWSYARKVVAIRCALKVSAKHNDTIQASHRLLTELMDVVSTKEWEDIINSLFEENYDSSPLQGLMKHKGLQPISQWLKSISLNREKLLDEVIDDLKSKKVSISSSDKQVIELFYWQCLVNEKYSSQSRPSYIPIESILHELAYRHFNVNTTKLDDRYKGRSSSNLEQTELFDLSINGKSPEWLKSTQSVSLGRRLNEQLNANPKQFIKFLLHIENKQDALFRVFSAINLTRLITKLESEIPAWKSVLVELLKLLNSVQRSAIYNSNLPDIKIQLVEVLLNSWLEYEKGVPLSAKEIGIRIQPRVAPVIDEVVDRQILDSLSVLGEALTPNRKPKETVSGKTIEVERIMSDQRLAEPVNPPVQNQISKNQIIEVNNAGLVLLQGYLTMYLERLELLDKDDKTKFKDLESQYKAVHCLQYLVTGMTDTEEHYLLLNKLLCNLPFTHPIPRTYSLTDADKEIAHGLIEAMINYWPECGGNSIDGFRGNWLVRDGILKEQDDQWELIVSKRSYDIMLNRSPFSYSIIRLPWMLKPIYVSWHV
jgi:Contractile injection system tape measure protein